MLLTVSLLDLKIDVSIFTDGFRLLSQKCFVVILKEILRLVESIVGLLHHVLKVLIPLPLEVTFRLFARRDGFQDDGSRWIKQYQLEWYDACFTM